MEPTNVNSPAASKPRHIVDTWRYQRSDGFAELATLLGVLALGIERGIALGIVLTLLSYPWRTSRPHIAIVGRVPHTEHFRDVLRHEVQTWLELLLIRVGENPTFANAGFVEDFIATGLAHKPQAKHLVLICTSISHIDTTALESLESIAESLQDSGITLHLAEVKGPVMDDLKRTDFLQAIQPGRVFFSNDEAVACLTAWGRES
ncbi:MAG: STAS domain-containing protein [Methylococcaceae bacterium]|nr:STAS domain-containing protein [Methylococcaceae bacterium]